MIVPLRLRGLVVVVLMAFGAGFGTARTNWSLPSWPGIVTPAPPAPIQAPGLRVLMVYDSSQKKSADAQSVMEGAEVLTFLALNCVAGPDGRTKEFRIFEKGADVSRESQTWRDAMARPRASYPWLLVSNGKTGFEGPLPGKAATLELLGKYK